LYEFPPQNDTVHTISSRKSSRQRRIEEVLETLADMDTLVVTELSRLGRSTAEVITLVNELVARNIGANPYPHFWHI
jgi:DNA invertase Pin-like site-specific DNA recombinase